MNAEKPGMFQPALIGGAFLGVTSAIPVLEYLNCACCALIIGGGVLAVHFYLRDYPASLAPPTYGDGALLGLLSGALGTLIHAVASIPMFLLSAQLFSFGAELEEALDDPEIPAELAEMLRQIFTADAGLGLILGITVLCFLGPALVFGTLGGILGIALLQKKDTAPPVEPPEPQSPPDPGGGSGPPAEGSGES